MPCRCNNKTGWKVGKNMAIITRSNADALIPVETSREIIKEVAERSKLLPLMRRLPNMTAKQRTLDNWRNF